MYNSIAYKVNNLKSFSYFKGNENLRFKSIYIDRFEYRPYFKFSKQFPIAKLTLVSYEFVTDTVNTSFFRKSSKLPKVNNNIFLWIMVKLLKVGKFVFSSSSISALLGVLPSFYLHKAIKRSDNRFLKNFYKSNFILPSLNLSKLRKLKKHKKKGPSRLSSSYTSYSLFLGTLLTAWLESPIAIVILNLKMFFVNLSKSKLLGTLVKKNIRFHYKVGTGFFIKEAVQVILVSLSLKDPVLLMGWFTKIMEKVQFFKHKNYVMFFKSIFNDLNKGVLRRMGIRGLYFDIRGKLAVKGDSKKRHVLLRYGECTFSEKLMKISPAYGVVHTFTGILGVTFILFY